MTPTETLILNMTDEEHTKAAHRVLVERCRATNSLLGDEIEAEFRALLREGSFSRKLVAQQSEIIFALEQSNKELREALRWFRVRVFTARHVEGHSHSTACTIWGDDGQGGTAEGFQQPLPCTCGCLENYARHEERERCAGIADREAAKVEKPLELARKRQKNIFLLEAVGYQGDPDADVELFEATKEAALAIASAIRGKGE